MFNEIWVLQYVESLEDDIIESLSKNIPYFDVYGWFYAMTVMLQKPESWIFGTCWDEGFAVGVHIWCLLLFLFHNSFPFQGFFLWNQSTPARKWKKISLWVCTNLIWMSHKKPRSFWFCFLRMKKIVTARDLLSWVLLSQLKKFEPGFNAEIPKWKSRYIARKISKNRIVS